MGKFYIVRRPKRAALVIPLGGTRARPTTIVPLYKMDDSELDELVEALLEKRKIKHEKSRLNELAEAEFENRAKVNEVRREIRRRIAEQAEFSKLKWGGLKPPKHH